VTEPSGPNNADQTTTYTYDALDRLVGVAHPNGAVRQWVYKAGTPFLMSESHPESGETKYSDGGTPWYSGSGLLLRKTEANGQETGFGYDGSHRVTSVSPVGEAATTIQYDDWGNRRVIARGGVQTTFDYSPDGVRLKSRTDAVAGTTPAFLTTYQDFDDRDNPGKMTYPSGRLVGFDYDTANRVTTVCAPNPAANVHGCTSALLMYASGITYHGSGGVASVPHANGVTDEMRHDYRNRPEHLTVGTTLDLTYGYYANGNVQSVTETTRAGNPASAPQTFTYDAVDRLKTATGGWGSLGYEYDAVGNRKSETRNGVEYAYTVPTSNRLSGTSVNQQPQRWFEYTAAGDLREDDRGIYAYTPGHLVASYTTKALPPATFTYAYDADDQRIWKAEGSLRKTYTVRGAGNLVLSEFEETGGLRIWTRDYLYAGSTLIGAVRPSARLTVQLAGMGSGRIVLPGFDCVAGTCTASYTAGTSVPLWALPNAGSLLVGWSGDCSGPNYTVTVTMGTTTACTATFNLLPIPMATKLAPANGSTLGGGTAVLSWQAVPTWSPTSCASPTCRSRSSVRPGG
jgi:YD repeat-containing protein